jgi:CHASE2 domain-containing sensor protein
LIGAMGFICCLLITLMPKGELGVIVGVVGLLGSVIGLSIFLFNHQNFWLDVVPLLAVINGHFALATAYQRYLVVQQRNRLQDMLSKQKEA